MFGHDYFLQFFTLFLLVLPSLVSSHSKTTADAQPRWEVRAHQTKVHFHGGLQEPVHQKRRRSQGEQRMEGLSSSPHAPFGAPRQGRTFESEIQPYPPLEEAGRPLSNSRTQPNPPRPGRITHSEISPYPLQEGAEGQPSQLQTPPSPQPREIIFHSEISPHSPEQGAVRPLPSSRTPLSSRQRVRITHSEIVPVEAEEGRLSPRSPAPPGPPRPGRVFAHVGGSSTQVEAGRLSPLRSPPGARRAGRGTHAEITAAEDEAGILSRPHSPPGSPRPGRTIYPETPRVDSEAGRSSPTRSPPGSPRAGRITPFEIALARAEDGRLLPNSHVASTGSPPRAGTTNRLGVSVLQTEAQARRICAPLQRFWNPPDVSEEGKLLRRMCCKFFAGFCTVTAAGPVYVNVGAKAGLPMYTAAGVMGLHGFQDMYKFLKDDPIAG
ncbi:Caskin-2 [Trapelia coarctata]|nr:Caskin-2 [Trapelia coarctata]